MPFTGSSHTAKVLVVVSEPSPPAARRLSDLRPGDRTLENLLRTVTVKLDLCSRLPVYEYEAETEGQQAGATAFRELAFHERRSLDELLACLRSHLDETPLRVSRKEEQR